MARGNRNYDRIKSVLDKLLTGEYNIKREILMFNRLYKLYPDFEFWAQFKSIKTTTSLAWFLSKWGAPEVKRDWNNYINSKMDKPKEPEFDLGLDEENLSVDTVNGVDAQEIPAIIKRKSIVDMLD